MLAFHRALPDFVVLRRVEAAGPRLPSALGRGESEAILLAKEIHADLLLTDDHKARRTAASLGINCAGLLSLIVRPKQAGQISSARDFIELLEKRGGLYLAEAVKAEALKLAGGME